MSGASADTIKSVTASEDISRHQLVQVDGSLTTGQGDRAFGVALDSADNGEEVPVAVAGEVKITCEDTNVSKGDLVVPNGTTNGSIEADAGTASEIVCGKALKNCDTAGEAIPVEFDGNLPAN